MDKVVKILPLLLLFGGVAVASTRRSMMRPLKYWHVTSKFGNRIHPVSGNNDFHNGLDLRAPVNTKVYAPEDGEVVSVYFTTAGGHQLIIEHDNGFTTGYAHLNAYKVKVGDRVKKGQHIANTGDTGQSTGPHLHFTLRDKSRKIIDPEIYF